MGRNYAVVAHFSPFNRLDENFILLINCLEAKFDKVVLVSTSLLTEEDTLLFPSIKFIIRPNIGYDFYSYKVGYEYLKKNHVFGNILFTNSSFYILNEEVFKKTLTFAIELSKNFDVVGMTSSRQISWHLQSYFLLINKRLLREVAMNAFFRSIQPLNSKFDLILQYELGLSSLLIEINAKYTTLFEPGLHAKIVASLGWGKRIFINSQKKMRFIEILRESRNPNLTHFCSRELAKKFGFIKSEVLRNNPHSLNLRFVKNHTTSEILTGINLSIDDTKSFYKKDHTGLTNFIGKNPESLSFTPIYYGQRGRIGVRIAVVMHLFYFDLLDEMASHLDSIIEPYDLFVTTPFQSDIPGIINKMATRAASITVIYGENRGRDMGPFIRLYRSGFLDNYLAVLKIHSKKSKYSSEGAKWRDDLYRSIVGSSIATRKIISLFERGIIGMVGPSRYYLTNGFKFWGSNYETVKSILISTNKFPLGYEPQLGFFAGSMFWFSPKAFIDIKGLPDDMINFEIENGKQDGSLAHAYERVFCILTRATDMVVTSPDLAGNDIAQLDLSNNKVPVL